MQRSSDTRPSLEDSDVGLMRADLPLLSPGRGAGPHRAWAGLQVLSLSQQCPLGSDCTHKGKENGTETSSNGLARFSVPVSLLQKVTGGLY